MLELRKILGIYAETRSELLFNTCKIQPIIIQ